MADAAERDRAQRASVATDLQIQSSIRGFAKFAMVGMGLVAFASFYSPTVRVATPSAKAYAVLVVGTFGACIAQDSAVVQHMTHQRTVGTPAQLRKHATDELHERGVFPTEARIYAEIERIRKGQTP